MKCSIDDISKLYLSIMRFINLIWVMICLFFFLLNKHLNDELITRTHQFIFVDWLVVDYVLLQHMGNLSHL